MLRLAVWLALLASAFAPARAQQPTPAAARVLHALDLGDRLRPLEARAELRAVLEGELGGADDAAAPELVLAARALLALDDDLEDWPAIEAWYAGLAERRARAPGELASLLDHGHALALRALGRNADALARTRALGCVTEGWFLGPFDNERGAGFERVLAPERGSELDARVAGKARELHWRRNPAPEHPLGRVLLHELVRPTQDGVAYFATVLDVARETDALVVLSTGCAFRLWLDGREVAERAARRPAAPDQDWVPVQLAAGRNELVLELANEDQSWWGFALRVADARGRGLAGVRVDASALQRIGVLGRDGGARDAALDPPALRALAARASTGADPTDAALLAQLEFHAHPADAQDARLVQRAEQWVERAPDSPAAWQGLAHALRGRLPRALEEEELDRRLRAWRRVLELDPTHAGALASLAEHCIDDAPQPERAEQLTARALAAAPASARALLLRARHLEGRGRALEARALREHALELSECAAQPWAALARAELARASGAAQASVDALRAAFAARRLSGPLRDALRARLVDLGRIDEALEVERQVLAGAPFELDALLAQAELHELAGAPEAARERLAAALALCPEEPQTWRALARVELRVAEQHGRRPADLASVDRAYAGLLALEPGDARARRARALLSAADGASFEAPYRFDGLARAAAHRASPLGAEPVLVVERTKVWKIDADGTEHVYEHLLLRAQNERGVQMLDEWPIAHEPRSLPHVHALRAIRADGSFERATPPRRSRTTDSGLLVRVWDLPPLSSGDYVEAEWRVDASGPDLFGRYFGARHLFQAEFPDPQASVLRSELVVLSAPELNVYVEERNGELLEHEVTVDANGLRSYRFLARDLARLSPEGFMPPLEELVPVVDLSTYANWTEFGRWWWHFISKELDASAALRAKVAELVAGKASERERVESILRFVAQEVRYNSWPFGTHGYEPYSATTIFERRLGDCKDKSILLKQMLAEIGVAARPVLIRAEHRRPDEPLLAAMVEHFNHCIAWIEPTPERAGYFLDATAEHNPLDYLREDDQGAEVLVVGPDGVERRSIPYASADDNELRRRYSLELDATGAARIALRDDSVGGFAVRLRDRYSGRVDARAARLADELERSLGKVDVEAIRSSELDDIAAPAWLEADLRAARVWTQEAGGPSLALAFDALPIVDAAAEPASERRTDLVFDRPFALRTEVEWKLPATHAVRALPEDVEIAVPGLLDYRRSARATQDGFEVRRRFRLLERRIPVARYAEFQDALRRIAGAEQARVELRASGEGKR